MKNCLICFICLTFSFCLCSCCSAKQVATTHTECIEERVMPIPVGADTIEITLYRNARLERPLTREGQNPTSTVSPQSVQIHRATSCVARERIEEKEKVKSEQSVLSVGDKKSQSDKNSVRIKSTRGVNISRYETDTTSTLRITLRPDTVFVPYTHHIRSDTIVVPDRVCQQKLNHSNMTNLFLILILIAIIIYSLRS